MDITTPRRVGTSNLEVTPLGFGGGTIGNPQVSTNASLATVAAAWDSGVRFFDTAPWYGIGRSERRLGLALAGLGSNRDGYQINTKVGKSLLPEPTEEAANASYSPGGEIRTPRDPRSGFRVHFDYGFEAIVQQHRDSLQRLGHARVDSLTIHDIDYGYHDDTLIGRHLEQLDRNGGGGARALEELRAGGAIKAIGCGCNLENRNAASWLTSAHEDLIERIAEIVDLDFLVVAGGYTLLETRALRRILPFCEAHSIGVVIAAPYASGWLVDPGGAATYMYGEAPAEVVERSQKIEATCARHDVPMAAAALQFVLAHPAVAAAIPGAKHPSEPTQNQQWLHQQIPKDLWSELQSNGLIDAAAPIPA